MGKITDKEIKAKPDTQDRWLNETVIRGHGALVVRITPTGLRSFYFRYTDSEGKRVRLPMGPYTRRAADGCLTLVEARLKAKALASLHQNGITNLREHLEVQEKRKEARLEAAQIKLERANQHHRARMSVEDLFEYWMQTDVVRRKDKGAEMRRLFSKDILPFIGDLAAEDIRRRHITEVTDPLLARNTPRMAKVVLSSLRQMFRFALMREIVEADPTAAISKVSVGGKSVERDRVLSHSEIRQLSQLLPQSGLIKTTEIAVWIALSTGCRIGELLNAQWRDIHLEHGEWYIPHTKNQQPHTVYLSEFALNKFKELKQQNGLSEWCYPNRRFDGPVCSKTVNKQLQDRQRPAEKGVMSNRSQRSEALILPGGKWTPHDLRRTAATMMVEAGVLPEVAERCLNHIEQNRIKRTYQRHSYANEMRSAWSQLGQMLEQLS